MCEDSYLDTFMEDQINGGYGYILDQMEGENACPHCGYAPCQCHPELEPEHEETDNQLPEGYETPEEPTCLGEEM